jgi:hypothetical protein
LTITDFNEQKKMLNRVISERLTVRQLDDELKDDEKEDVNMFNTLLQAFGGNNEKSPSIDETIEKIETLELDEPIDTNGSESAQDMIQPKASNPFDFKGSNSLEDETVSLNHIASSYNPFSDPDNEYSTKEEKKNNNVEKKNQEAAPSVLKLDTLESVTKALNNLERDIEKAGFNITSEKFDFDDLYQVVIKIGKSGE